MSMELEPKFHAPAPHQNFFGSGSSHPKLLGLQLHSPGYSNKPQLALAVFM